MSWGMLCSCVTIKVVSEGDCEILWWVWAVGVLCSWHAGTGVAIESGGGAFEKILIDDW